MKENTHLRVMVKVHKAVKRSGLSLQDVGLRMGYPEATARKSAWQFLRSKDPRLSMLFRFAQAMGLDVKELI
jgi:transcriptional regulator with XRE-family HTH domain